MSTLVAAPGGPESSLAAQRKPAHFTRLADPPDATAACGSAADREVHRLVAHLAVRGPPSPGAGAGSRDD